MRCVAIITVLLLQACGNDPIPNQVETPQEVVDPEIVTYPTVTPPPPTPTTQRNDHPSTGKSSPSPAKESTSEVSSLPSATKQISLACGRTLLKQVGKTSKDAEKLPDLYLRHSQRKDEEFINYMFAIIYVESGFDRHAVSDKAAYGLMQMTSVAVKDAQKYCNLRPIPDMEHMFDSATNIRYGTCFLKKISKDLDGDWIRTLILYNGGYKQLQRYDKGDNVVYETANYVLRVQRALSICNGSSGETYENGSQK